MPRKKKPQNHVLYVRNLQPQTIRALKWAQEHFNVGSNSQAAIHMIDRYAGLVNGLDAYEQRVVELERKLNQLTTLLQQRTRINERIEDYISTIENH